MTMTICTWHGLKGQSAHVWVLNGLVCGLTYQIGNGIENGKNIYMVYDGLFLLVFASSMGWIFQFHSEPNPQFPWINK